MNKKEEKAVVPVRKNTEKPGYWAHVSGAYLTVFRTLLFVLPIFVIVFMAICAQAFTRDSVFGFGNDLLSVSSFLSSDYQTVYYTYEQGERTVLSYRDGVAVITTEGIEVYSPDGTRLLDHSMKLSSPRAATSAKYLVVYDFSSTSFVVTNGYSVLFEGKTEFPILGATVTDTGHFALITSAQTHLSQVCLYDANFNLIQRFSRSSATTGVTISSNGKYVAFCGLTSESGVPKSVAELFRIGAKEPVFSVNVGETALAISFTDTRHLVLVTPQAGYSLDLDGEIERIDFGGAALVCYAINKNGCAFLLNADNVNAETRLLICDKRGAKLAEKTFDEDYTALALGDSYAYLLGTDVLLRVPVEEEGVEKKPVEGGAQGILLTQEGQLRLVYAGAAVYVEFD